MSRFANTAATILVASDSAAADFDHQRPGVLVLAFNALEKWLCRHREKSAGRQRADAVQYLAWKSLKA